MTHESGFVALNHEGGIAIKIPAEILRGKSYLRSVLKQRLFENLVTDDSKTNLEWDSGKDLNLALLYPHMRYQTAFLQQQITKLKKVLVELGLVDQIIVSKLHPIFW